MYVQQSLIPVLVVLGCLFLDQPADARRMTIKQALGTCNLQDVGGFNATKARLRRVPAPRHLRSFTTRFKGKRYLIVVNLNATDEDAACWSFILTSSSKRTRFSKTSKATGAFWRSGTTKVQAWGLDNGEGGYKALLWLDHRRRIVHSRLLDCSYGITVRRARLFADRDTLKVICRTGMGSDYSAEANYYHVFGNGQPRRILSAYLGIGFSRNKRGNKSCWQPAGGWVKILIVGRVPKVRIATPKPENGATRGTVADWTYQPKKKAFRRTSANKLMSFKQIIRCS